MTVQEAISYLKIATEEAGNEEFSDMYKEMCRMSIEALEKQEAKKYKTFVGESGIVRITYYECPCCGEIGIEHMQKHCHECGQKLDWGE